MRSVGVNERPSVWIMARYAIISDIHGNLEALEAVIEDLETIRIDSVVCLGDLLGYGADQVACLHIVRDLLAEYGETPPILGNHDEAGANGVYTKFSSIAQTSTEWGSQRLSEIDLAWLKSSRISYLADEAIFVHSSPQRPTEWEYILQPRQAETQFLGFEWPVCFIGHTHQPFVYVKGSQKFSGQDSLFLNEGRRYLINVGSVGQPRDGDNRASYALYDSETGLVNIRRIPYPIAGAAAKIREAGLPETLAARLHLGS